MNRPITAIKYLKTQFIWLLSSLSTLAIFFLVSDFKPLQFHLSLHTTMEILSVTISFMIFYLGWSTYDSEQPGNIFILSAIFLLIGLIDLAHMLSSNGMPDFFTPNNTHKAILFWQFARFFTAIGLLLFTINYIKPFRTAFTRNRLLFLTFVFAGLIYWTVLQFEHIWPITIIEGEGLTPYKIYVEYAILSIHIINLLWIVNERTQSAKYVKFNAKHAITALTLLTVSEFTFTLYTSAHDVINALGHVFKVIGFIYVFQAVFHENVNKSIIRFIHSEQELRDNNERMHTILKNTYDAVIIADSDRTIQFMNHNAEIWTGWKFGLTRSKRLEAVFQIVDIESFMQGITGVGTIKPGIIQDKLIQRQGTMSDIEYAASVVMSTSGKTSIIIVFRDITERVLSDRHKDRLLAILESAKDFISIADVDGRIVFYNKAAIEMLELADGENIEDILISDTHPEEIARRTQLEALPVAREKGIWKGESVLLSRQGKHIPVSQIIVSHKNENDEVEYFSTIMRDITEWKHSEEQTMLASRVFESIKEGIMVTDHHQKIVFVNKAFTTLTGYSFENVYNLSPKILSSGWHNSEFYEAMWSTIRATGTWRGEVWNKKKDGTLILEELSISRVTDSNGDITHYVGVFQDITVRKELEAKIHHQAFHDILTGLPNRILLQDRMSQAIHYVDRNKQKIGLLYVDVDRFKRINDHFGHHIGDKLLQMIAERMKNCLRASDTVARIGGDELIVLLPNLHSREHCRRLADKIKEQIIKPFYIESHELFITCSMGISIYPDDATDADQLLKLADSALYEVKKNGRNHYQFYDNSNTPANSSFSMEKSLRNALKNNEFTIYYQPIIQTTNQAVMGVEALIRWNHNQKGLISPAEFIPLAEDTGLILMIDRWVLQEACMRMKQWHEQGYHELRISVNLSMLQFQQPDLVKSVQFILLESGLPPSALILEITERTIMLDPILSIVTMQNLRNLGVNISLDDFGVGYSSFNYLKQLPINKLKIDRSFIKDITESDTDLSIVNALISMAHTLRLQVVAEGVENKEQLSLLLHGECDYIQGYLFNKPLTAEDFTSIYLTQ